VQVCAKLTPMPLTKSVTAVLGPTNTGKTHLAVERMLAHAGGMIGLPLRLLAREVYDKVRFKAGDHAVALVTGEEKIIPPQPRYWVCTVEAMPPDVVVPFLAIDEVQLANDLERGHIFTDRILHRRGTEETMLLGSATMRGILERLLPKTSFVSRPRFSKLSYAGQKKLSRLPRRSAIVAFTAELVYSVAEMIRTQRGGAAVVMGALSPRTRNAQIALFQSGDVDYVVATDAIGMGLNMDVDHVAFASTRKFDGFQFRNLTPAELGQVAGRAGRYMNDGTFGVSAEAEPFDQDVVDRLENHNFDSVRVLQWRNRDLNFHSLDTLRKSLGTLPTIQGLTRAQDTSDIEAVDAVIRDPSIADLLTSTKDIERAWEVCQIPDYRNISPAEHAHLVKRIIAFLQSSKGYISEDWFAKQLALCENLDGGIDALSTRISHVRTWTFVANRSDWLESPYFWQSRAKEIEDRLSDTLHERLTQRFIDRKTSVVMRRLARKEGLMTSVEDDGAIHVEGEFLGRIKGLTFVSDASLASPEQRALKTATSSAVAAEVALRAKALAMTADTALKLQRTSEITWQGNTVGRLRAGDHRFKPRVELIADDALQGDDRTNAEMRLQKFAERYISTTLEHLIKLEEAEGMEGLTRGIAFQLSEHYGVLPREKVAQEIKSLTQDDRAKLRGLGVRFGAFTIYLPTQLKMGATDLRLLLWWLEHNRTTETPPPAAPPNGLTSTKTDTAQPDGYYGICGYRICNTRAVRVDMLERLSDLIRDRVFWKPRIPEEQRPVGSVEGGGFTVFPDLMSLVGCSGEEFEGILESLGFRAQTKQIKRPILVPPAAAAPTDGAPTSETAPETTAETTAETTPAEPEAIVELLSETIEIKVWWPKDQGPFRPERKKPQHKLERPERSERPERTARKKFQKPKPSPKPERPERRERPADPNSPFAVLSALKSKMEGT
jgi:ATP-dependent RNA helicase SUPV3L1/SUV3